MESNDQERFIALFVRYESDIHSFILTIVPVSVDSDEILQEASLKMWQRFEQYTEGTNFKNWAFQIAKFTAMNHIRKVKRDRHVFTTKLVNLIASDVESHSSELGLRRAALNHCLAKLNAGDRDVLSSCYSKSQSVKELASRENRTANSVYKQLDRTRLVLYRCIRKTIGILGTA